MPRLEKPQTWRAVVRHHAANFSHFEQTLSISFPFREPGKMGWPRFFPPFSLPIHHVTGAFSRLRFFLHVRLKDEGGQATPGFQKPIEG
jgi:hypothetical protein